MDLHHSLTSRYQVLRNEENDRGPPAVEPPSTATQIDAPTAPPTPSASPPAPGLAFPEWSPSPPPYCPMPAEAETTSEAEGPREALPGPPPYSVATSLPTYDEAERAKAAALAAASGEPARGDDDLPPREASTASDPDPLLVGNDGIFLMAFVMAFIFNWLGFCLSFCTTSSIAGRCGALCGFGLSLTKWILIVRFSDYFTGYFNGQYWLWWIFLLLGLLLFFRGFYSYLKVRNMSERLATANRTRYIFRN